MSIRTLFALFFAMAMVLALPDVSRAQDGADGVVEVLFTSTMTKADLLTIQDQVKAKGVELKYKKMSIKDGRLVSLSFHVKTDKGEGDANGPVLPDGHLGFHYDPTPGAAVPFSVGSIKQP